MPEFKFSIVLTTINGGDVLDGYCLQAEKEGLREQLHTIVIPDRKSPPTLFDTCRALARRGFDIVCPTLPEQETFLSKVGAIGRLIPYNSDNRRNVGFLMALEKGCDLLISIDDDNYCMGGKDVFSTYAVVCGEPVTMPAVHSVSGWFNLCDFLQVEPAYTVYPRGFPYHKRHQPSPLARGEETGLVRLNAGLWLNEPDMDAITWLGAPVRAKAFLGGSLLLGQDTWTPINTQNTSLHCDLIVAYYFVRMGYPLTGMPIDRYGDIYSGYLLQACVRHFGHRIRVGTPVTDHRRNAHNYMRDLVGELACILTLEEFTEWLPGVRLSGTDYSTTYLSLADAIDDQIERFSGTIWTDATRGYFHQMTYCMRQWVKACAVFG